MKKLFTLILLTLFVAFGYLYYYFDSIVHSKVEEYLSNAIGVTVKIDNVYFKFIDGKFTLKGIKIQNPSGFSAPNILTVGTVNTSVDMKTIFENLIIIRYIKIEEPNIYYEISESGDNIRALKKGISRKLSSQQKSKVTGKSSTKKELQVIIHKFFINNGIINAEIKCVKKKEFKLPDIYLQNLGKDEKGITIENASEQVLRELTKAISKINLRTLFNEISNLPKSIPDMKNNFQDTFKKEKNKFFDNLLKN